MIRFTRKPKYVIPEHSLICACDKCWKLELKYVKKLVNKGK